MARSDVFQKIGPLEHQHSFDGREHAYPQAVEVRASTPGSLDPSSPLNRASTSARTTGLSSAPSSKARLVSDGAWRETFTAHALSQESPELQAARIHSARSRGLRGPPAASSAGSSSNTWLTGRNTEPGRTWLRYSSAGAAVPRFRC